MHYDSKSHKHGNASFVSTWGVSFHSLIVTYQSSLVACHLILESLVTRCEMCLLFIVNSLVTSHSLLEWPLVKKHPVFVAHFARYALQKQLIGKKIPHYSFLNSLVTCHRSSSLQKITHHSLQNSFATHYRNSENYFFRNLRKFRTWILNTLEAWPLEITIRLASIGFWRPWLFDTWTLQKLLGM